MKIETLSRIGSAFSKKQAWSMQDLWGEYSVLWQSSQANVSNLSYNQVATQGYITNPVVYACVNLKAGRIDELNFVIRYEDSNGKTLEIKEHEMLELLRKPVKDRASPDGVESIYFSAARELALGGEFFVKGVWVGGDEAPFELWSISPGVMNVVHGQTIGEYKHYEYNTGTGMVKLYPEDTLYQKLWNPLNPWRGLSPQTPAWGNVKIFNKALVWIDALLGQAARPSLALLAPGGLDTKVAKSLKKELRENYVGAKNAGRPMFLEGGIDIKEIGFAPNQMQFKEIINSSGSYITMTNDTPLELVGEMARKTYNNVFEARLVYHLKGVFPFANRIVRPLNHWLLPLYPDLRQLNNARLGYDRDSNEAMEELRDRRARRLERLRMAGVLNANEVRGEMGWPELDDPVAFKLYIARQVVELSEVLTSADIEDALGGKSFDAVQAKKVYTLNAGGKSIEIPGTVLRMCLALGLGKEGEKGWKHADLVDEFHRLEEGK